ncbi:MAG TPA: PEGA domain-containing protein [bacterium]|nr:PEGA domain-containing protein [bacterium]HPN43241.1 PEGA domain-containing protein [bacterium]
MWRTIKYFCYLSLLAVIMLSMGCAAKRIAVDEAYATLRPLKQLELPEQVIDNLVISIDNVADQGTSYKNSIEVFVNDININPNWDVANTESNYTYKLRVKPGYYKVKAVYHAYVGWGEEEFAVITQDVLVKVTHDNRTLVSVSLVKKANGELLEKKSYFTIHSESLAPLTTVQPTSQTPVAPVTPAADNTIILQVNVIPENAKVIVDDKTVGYAPLKVAIDRSSDHVVQFSADGYQTAIKFLDHTTFAGEKILHVMQELQKSE